MLLKNNSGPYVSISKQNNSSIKNYPAFFEGRLYRHFMSSKFLNNRYISDVRIRNSYISTYDFKSK